MGKKFIARWANIVVNHRVKVIINIILFSAVVIMPMKGLYFDNSSEIFFLKGDSNIINHNLLRDQSVDTEFLIVAIEAGQNDKTVFTPEILQSVSKLTNFFETHEAVTKVNSLTTYKYMKVVEDSLTMVDLIPTSTKINTSDESIDNMIAIMKGEEIAHGIVVTKDLKHTQILVRTLYEKETSDHRTGLIKDLNAFIANEQLNNRSYRLHFSGSPLIKAHFSSSVSTDHKKLDIVLLIILTIMLLLSFRSASESLIPWLAILSTVFFIMGIQGALSWPLDTIKNVLPVLLLIICMGNVVNLIVNFYHFRIKGLVPKKAAKSAVKIVFLPCLLTTITTAAGFFSLSVIKLLPIWQIGVFGGLVAILSLMLTLTLLPAVLSYFNRVPKKLKLKKTNGIYKLFTKLSKVTFKRRKVMNNLSIILVLVSIVLCSQLTSDSNFFNSFSKKNQFYKDLNYFNTVFTKGVNIDLTIDSGYKDGLKDPGFLTQIMLLQKYIESLQYTGKTSSILNHLLKLHQAMNGNNPEYNVVPDNRELVEQYMSLYQSNGSIEDLSKLKSIDGQHVKVSIPIKNMTAIETDSAIQEIKQALKSKFSNLNIIAIGPSFLNNTRNIYTKEGLKTSFFAALLAISICLLLLFRSIKYSLITLIPGILPIVFTWGVMATFKIPLNIGSLLLGAITIGIAVDDTIHIMLTYVNCIKSGKSVRESIVSALNKSGRAIIYASIFLICGFCIFVFGPFMNTVYSCLFSLVIMWISLLGDLIILPAILFMADSGRMVSKLSQENHFSIIEPYF